MHLARQHFSSYVASCMMVQLRIVVDPVDYEVEYVELAACSYKLLLQRHISIGSVIMCSERISLQKSSHYVVSCFY